MTVANHAGHPRTEKALAAGESVLVYTKATTETVHFATEAAEWFGHGRAGLGGTLTFLATTVAAKKVFAVAKPLATERDKATVAKAEKAVSAVVSCGTAAVAAVTVGVSGGLTAFITISQGLVCLKDLADLVTVDKQGRGWFDQSPGWKWAGLAVETVGAIGSLFGLGVSKVARPAAGVIGRFFAASKAQQIGVGAEFAGAALKGVGVILEPGPDGQVHEAPPAPGQVERILDESGLPWRNPLLDPECLFLKVSPRCLFGGRYGSGF